MISCLIIEDQPPAQRILEKYIADIEYLELVGIYSNPLDALQFLKEHSVDLLFLDIHLPKISGIDFLQILDKKPQVILTTAFSDYAIQSYELNAIDYLLKPFSFERFTMAVTKVYDLIKSSVSTKSEDYKDFLFVKSGHEYIKIIISEIECIEASSDYSEVYIHNKKILTTFSLKTWLLKLPNNQFVQIHKSHIINNHKVVKVVGNLVYLESEKQLPIGRAYKESFISNFLK